MINNFDLVRKVVGLMFVVHGFWVKGSGSSIINSFIISELLTEIVIY